MAEDYVDPSGSTEQFRAFTRDPEPPAKRSPAPLVAGIVIAVVVVGLLVFLIAS